MANLNNMKGKQENELIGTILAESKFSIKLIFISLADDTEDFFTLRSQMGKSISAPPPGLGDSVKLTKYFIIL
jgi:hypothetical protein